MSGNKHSEEKTFRSYDRSQSEHYARMRMDYHSSVYEAIIDQHTATGGQWDRMLDIGCGPGQATRTLAPHFQHAKGIDASKEMIEVARDLSNKASHGEPVSFEVSTAEDMAGVDAESVDLITAATAAHWFDMPAFWKRAAEVLKPGGSVALWTSSDPSIHPATPNAAALNEAHERFSDEHLKPYYEPGNMITRDGYRTLKMPWDVTPKIEAFDRASFLRRDWTTSELFHVGQDRPFSLDTLELMLATASPVARWRQAHPDKVGTEQDAVRGLRREIEALLREVGVPEGGEVLRGFTPGVLLMVKKVSS